jgi:hypothetical protein
VVAHLSRWQVQSKTKRKNAEEAMVAAWEAHTVTQPFAIVVMDAMVVVEATVVIVVGVTVTDFFAVIVGVVARWWRE